MAITTNLDLFNLILCAESSVLALHYNCLIPVGNLCLKGKGDFVLLSSH